jgi:hypothetical protein
MHFCSDVELGVWVGDVEGPFKESVIRLGEHSLKGRKEVIEFSLQSEDKIIRFQLGELSIGSWIREMISKGPSDVLIAFDNTRPEVLVCIKDDMLSGASQVSKSGSLKRK